MKKIIYIIITFSFLASCTSKQAETSETENTGSTVITVSESEFSTNQMNLVSLKEVAFATILKTTGKVDVPPEYTAAISTYYPGYVKGIKLLEGQYVRKGQRLFLLENPEYVQIQQDFLEAKEQLEYLQSEYQRQKTLAAENIASQKNYLKAKSEYAVTQTRYEALKKKLNLMGISTNSLVNNNLRSSISITAPIAGYVSAINVSQGKILSPNEVALIITNTDHLHVEMMVFENDILKVKEGQKINYKFAGSSKELGGEVHLVGKAVTEGKNAISVHGHINNSAELKNMYPGMFVEAEITASTQNHLGLPESSVIDLEGKLYVLVLKDKNDKVYTFAKKEVKILSRSNGYLQVEGIDTTARVLENGAFDLITE
jgi:cobalt-zinc-cadmium efflux system membrane fusion protein